MDVPSSYKMRYSVWQAASAMIEEPLKVPACIADRTCVIRGTTLSSWNCGSAVIRARAFTGTMRRIVISAFSMIVTSRLLSESKLLRICHGKDGGMNSLVKRKEGGQTSPVAVPPTPTPRSGAGSAHYKNNAGGRETSCTECMRCGWRKSTTLGCGHGWAL
jgi:hypothetical protein